MPPLRPLRAAGRRATAAVKKVGPAGDARAEASPTRNAHGTSLRLPAIANAKWVAGRFDLSRRRDNLTWSHHREVAGIEDDGLPRAIARNRDEVPWALRVGEASARHWLRSCTIRSQRYIPCKHF